MDHHDMTHVHEKFMTFTRVFFFLLREIEGKQG